MEHFFQTPGYFGGERDELLCGFVLVALAVSVALVVYQRRVQGSARTSITIALALLLILIGGSCTLLWVSFVNGVSRLGG